MGNRIITISREFGSGGRTIGRKVAQQLGIACYDREIIGELAKKTKFAEEFVEESSEYVHSAWFSGFTMGMVTPQDQLWQEQAQLIEELAQKGSCVIVGRCADYILRGKADCLRVFIHADYDFRARRVEEVYGQTEVPAIQRLKEKDKSRKAYYLHYTDTKWGKLANYDVVLNSGVIGIDRCASVIASLY